MVLKVLAVAGWAVVSAISVVQAQTLTGPAETPPASFKGTQYVDSRGCIYLRAGIGGRVTWVPRISRDRKALCSKPRAENQVAAAEPAPKIASKPAARVQKKTSRFSKMPMETIASLPRATAKPAPTVIAATSPQATPRSVIRLQKGCPTTSPYGARVLLADGTRALICSANQTFDLRAAANRAQVARNTPDPGIQIAAQASTQAPAPQSPVKASYVAGGYRCPAEAPVARRYAIRGGGSTVMCIAAQDGLKTATPPLALGDRAETVVPKGYRKAWKDGRLNPNRGKGTAEGQAQQDQIWSRDLPAELVANAAAAKKGAGMIGTAYATSASNAPRADEDATARYFVQVATFGIAANAARTTRQLQGLGLPVAKSRIISKGRNLQIVLAGPFDDTGSAKAALSIARRSGFDDAFIR